MLNKEEINNIIKDIKVYIHDWLDNSTDEDGYEINPIDDYNMDFINNIENLIEYTKQLEQENNKQSKIIDKMALEIAFYDNYKTFCKKVYPNDSCIGNGIPCWDCVKQYFEKKVEES